VIAVEIRKIEGAVEVRNFSTVPWFKLYTEKAIEYP